MISPALMIHVGMLANGKEQIPYITADVQVWNGKQHIITVDMRSGVKPDQWTLKPEDSLEQWAAQMGRQVARLLEDNFMQCAQSGQISYVQNYEMVTEVTLDPKQ